MLIGVAMEINEHIDEAVKKIKYSLSDGLVAKSIIYYQSGRRMTGYVDNYNIDSRLPRIEVRSKTGKVYNIPFYNVIRIETESGF